VSDNIGAIVDRVVRLALRRVFEAIANLLERYIAEETHDLRMAAARSGWLNAEAAAKYCGSSTSHVRRLGETGELDVSRVGTKPVYSVSSIQDYMARRTTLSRQNVLFQQQIDQLREEGRLTGRETIVEIEALIANDARPPRRRRRRAS
jgi:hypothetical protein